MICHKCGMQIPGRSVCPYCKADLSTQKTTDAIITVAISFATIIKFFIVFIVNIFKFNNDFHNWLEELSSSSKFKKMSVGQKFNFMKENIRSRKIP